MSEFLEYKAQVKRREHHIRAEATHEGKTLAQQACEARMLKLQLRVDELEEQLPHLQEMSKDASKLIAREQMKTFLLRLMSTKQVAKSIENTYAFKIQNF